MTDNYGPMHANLLLPNTGDEDPFNLIRDLISLPIPIKFTDIAILLRRMRFPQIAGVIAPETKCGVKYVEISAIPISGLKIKHAILEDRLCVSWLTKFANYITAQNGILHWRALPELCVWDDGPDHIKLTIYSRCAFVPCKEEPK